MDIDPTIGRDITTETRLVPLAGVALALVLIAACDAGPTAPSPTLRSDATDTAATSDGVLSAIGPEVVHLREVDASRLRVAVVTPNGQVDVFISRPSEMTVGTATVDGRPVCLPGAQDCDRIPDAKDGQVRPQIAVAPIVLWAIRAYATWDFFRGCAKPAWSDFRARGINGITQSTTENCLLTGASEAAGGVLGSYLRGVGVTRLRGAIKDGVGRRLTWSQLRTALNKNNFRDVVDIVTELARQFFQRVYDGIYEAMQRL